MVANSTILLIDDEPDILDLLKDQLEPNGYHCLLAPSGERGLAILESEPVDLVICDIHLGRMDGITVLRMISENWPDTVRIALSGMGDKNDIAQAINRGNAHAYFNKPWDIQALLTGLSSALWDRQQAIEKKQQTEHHMTTLKEERNEAVNLFQSLTEAASDSIMVVDDASKFTYWNRMAELMFGYSRAEAIGKDLRDLFVDQNQLSTHQGGNARDTFKLTGQGSPWVDNTTEVFGIHRDGHQFPVEASVSAVKLRGRWHGMGIIRDITDRKRIELESANHSEQLHNTLIETIGAIAAMVEKRDPYTSGHQNRVSQLSAAIASELGLSDEQIEGITLGATIHDIGKIYIPAEILNRPGKLTNAEFEIIKTHSTVGYDIIKNVDFPWPIAAMVRQHHERLDGSGYPDGLSGDAIIIEAQIIAVADVVEAIASHRPYRAALGIHVSLDEIRKHRNDFFNPDVVDACLKLIEGDFQFSE